MSYLHERIVPNKYLPIKVFSFESASIDRIIIDHWHKSTELLYCVEGSLNVWLNAKKHTLKAGDAIFINSNVVHSSQSPTGNKVLVIQTPIEFMDQISFGKYNKDVIINLNQAITETDLSSLIETIYIHSKDEDWVGAIDLIAKISKLYHLLFLSYAKPYQEFQAIETQKYLDRLANITDYIRDNHYYDLSLKEVSDHFGFNMHYFSRFFKKYMGITFLEYLGQIRLDTAYRLLLDTDTTIANVASQAGFRNVKSFSQLFKQHYRLTPFAYRKSINALNQDK